MTVNTLQYFFINDIEICLLVRFPFDHDNSKDEQGNDGQQHNATHDEEYLMLNDPADEEKGQEWEDGMRQERGREEAWSVGIMPEPMLHVVYNHQTHTHLYEIFIIILPPTLHCIFILQHQFIASCCIRFVTLFFC